MAESAELMAGLEKWMEENEPERLPAVATAGVDEATGELRFRWEPVDFYLYCGECERGWSHSWGKPLPERCTGCGALMQYDEDAVRRLGLAL